MKDYKQRVRRRWICWAIGSPIILAIMLSLAYALVRLVMDAPLPTSAQTQFLCIIGGVWLTITFVLGQAFNNMLIRSWDTWLGDLGPTQIDVLNREMQLHAQSMREGEKIRK